VPAIEPGMIEQVSTALRPLIPYSKTVGLIAAGLAFAGAIYAIYHRLKIRGETGR
jgi:hypothetical protein